MKKHRTQAPRRWETLRPEDWDFRRLRSDQASLECHIWEFLREWVLSMEAGSFPPPTTDTTFRKWQKKYLQTYPSGLPPLGQGFPSMAYIKPPNQKGVTRVAKPEVSDLISVPWDQVFDQYGPGWTRRPPKNRFIWANGSELVALWVHWEARDEVLVRLFASFLKANRPAGKIGDPRPRIAEPPPVHSKKGAGSDIRQVKADLKALAAYRVLVHKMGVATSAMEHETRDGIPAVKILGADFENRAAWSKAKARVGRQLQEVTEWVFR
jgi:hypothetical protein